MTLFTKGDVRKFFIVFCIASGGMLVLNVYGFLGYMASSARQSFCKSPPVGAEDCPLDYFLAAVAILQTWLGGMAVLALSFVIFVALPIAAVRWIRARSPTAGDG